ncbi:hypothetical protein MRX96_039914 [Rhipicephalus microplus]
MGRYFGDIDSRHAHLALMVHQRARRTVRGEAALVVHTYRYDRSTVYSAGVTVFYESTPTTARPHKHGREKMSSMGT